MRKIYHLVLARFRAEKSHRAAELLKELDAFRKRLPGFLSLTGGPYTSSEGLNQGYTHGFVMTFVDAATRDRYLAHPEHEQIKQSFLPDLEGVVAFDFEGE